MAVSGTDVGMSSYEQHMKVWVLRYATVSKCYLTSNWAKMFESSLTLGLETVILKVLTKDEIVSHTFAVAVMWSMPGNVPLWSGSDSLWCLLVMG